MCQGGMAMEYSLAQDRQTKLCARSTCSCRACSSSIASRQDLLQLGNQVCDPWVLLVQFQIGRIHYDILNDGHALRIFGGICDLLIVEQLECNLWVHGRNSAGFFRSTWWWRLGAWRGRRLRRQVCWIKGQRVRWNLGHLVLDELKDVNHLIAGNSMLHLILLEHHVASALAQQARHPGAFAEGNYFVALAVADQSRQTLIRGSNTHFWCTKEARQSNGTAEGCIWKAQGCTQSAASTLCKAANENSMRRHPEGDLPPNHRMQVGSHWLDNLVVNDPLPI
mmetsp:Transcript_9211/g.21891  ORF Transcript_9211/g.21891 Transcript_9211/m.21891 type:complete len:280 (-) Transcript_9211:715-1554(-)